jgi:hypothetical protein
MRTNGVTPKALTLMKTGMTFFQDAIKTVPDGSSEDEAKEAIMQYFINKLTEVSKKVFCVCVCAFCVTG